MRGLNDRAAVADVLPEVTQRSFQVGWSCTHGDSSIKTVLRSPDDGSVTGIVLDLYPRFKST